MARFKAGVREVTPLRLRLESDIYPVVVCEAYAYSDSTTGSCGWPTFIRSEVELPPTSVVEVQALDRGTNTAQAGLQLAQEPAETGTSPTGVTIPPIGAANLPIRWQWKVPVDSGFVVTSTAPLVFIARSRAGYTWTAGIVWEEP